MVLCWSLPLYPAGSVIFLIVLGKAVSREKDQKAKDQDESGDGENKWVSAVCA
jgi:hypothetical protein